MNTQIKVKFLGGIASSNNLTGSCIWLSVKEKKETVNILIDAGLIQCSHKDFFKNNREILRELGSARLDYIVLTHAHTDHGGRMPLLAKSNFGADSKIICTTATARIIRVMLEDSAKIQSEMARVVKTKNKKSKPERPKNLARDQMALGQYDKIKRKKAASKMIDEQALYDLDDVDKTCSFIKNGGYPYQQWIKLSHNCSLKFYESGHVLGGAVCVIHIQTQTKNLYLGFSGDLGRDDGIILPPPAMVQEPIDYWCIESTYGGKTHPEREVEIGKLQYIINQAARRKQRIIIPSFALERAQEIIYLLSYFMQVGKVKPVPMFLDSPMAFKITDIFADSWEEGMFLGQEKLTFNPFRQEENAYLKIVTDIIDSNNLVKSRGASVVIAGSGMCEYGRVRNYLRDSLGKDDVVCLVGYMANDSLGRRLKDRFPIVRMNGEEIVIKSEIYSFETFSAHADSPFLVKYTKEIADISGGKLKKVFIVHGEEKGAIFLKKELIQALSGKGNLFNVDNVIIPTLNEDFVF